MNDLERLVAIEDIKNLKARRIRAMDEKRWDDYEAMHAADHVSETYAGGEPAIGAKANTARLAKVLGHITSVHHAHTPEITITSATTAEGVWAMEDMLWWNDGEKELHLHGYGHYHEEYRKEDGRWLISYRTLTRLRVDQDPGFFRFMKAL